MKQMNSLRNVLLHLSKKDFHLQVQRNSLATMLPTLDQQSEEVLTVEKQRIISVDQPNTFKILRGFLLGGEVIAIPTDTVYGLACDANNEQAIQKLYQIKGRNSNKPVAICVKDFPALRRYGNAEHLNDDLLERLLPGPITIVIERSSQLSNRFLNPSTKKIGIRIPKLQFIQQLCAFCDEHPLALTSANRSAECSSLNVQEFAHLWSQLGSVVDAGQIGLTEECRSASTVVDLATPGRYTILRPGVALKRTLQVMEEFGLRPLSS